MSAKGFWWLGCLVIAVVAAAVFTSVPSLLVDEKVVLPPAYELKAQHPLADTSQLTVPAHAGERSHGAKLTPRLVGSLFLHWASALSLHPYVPATIFGVLFLLSGILIGYQVTGDRLAGFFVGLAFAGLYAAAASFTVIGAAKPFDGVAIGLAALTMISVRRPWLLATFAFLSMWTDERAVISLALIACLVIAWPAIDARAAWTRCVVLAASVIAYFLSRLLLAQALGWSSPDLSYVGIPPKALLFAPVAVWSCFEGSLVTIAITARVLVGRRDRTALWLLLGAVALAVLPCLLVLDLSRTSCFAFPVIPMAYALLKKHGSTTSELRALAGLAAVISLLAPNFEIITGITIDWVPAFLPSLFW